MSDPISVVLTVGCQLHGAEPGNYCRDFMVCAVRINHSLGHAVAEWVGDGYAVRTHEDIAEQAFEAAKEFYGQDPEQWEVFEWQRVIVSAIDKFKHRPCPPAPR
jgi:hypothetical protein